MSTTKYIVNNVLEQSIDGSLVVGQISATTISGDTIYINGYEVQPYKKFVGLLTSNPETLTSGNLIVGETYEITSYLTSTSVSDFTTISNGSGYTIGTYETLTSGNGLNLTINVDSVGLNGEIDSLSIDNPGYDYQIGDTFTVSGGAENSQYTITSLIGDDFSNVAEVISGTINQTGCVFKAIGDTPTEWSYNSQLDSYGVPLESNGTLKVLENTLNIPLSFSSSTSGQYVTISNNLFTSGNTYYSIGQYDWYSLGESDGYISIKNEVSSELNVKTYGSTTFKNGLLNNTPIEIKIYN